MDVAPEVARLSKLLFGSKYRLAVAANIAAGPEDRIYTRRIARALGIADNLVASELRRMQDAGLLIELPKAQAQTLFRRTPSPYWDCAQELVARAGSPTPLLVARMQAGESQFFEVRASVYADLISWIRGSDALRDDPDGPPARAALISIVAFLNSGGGTLMVGAVDDRMLRPGDAARLADCPRLGQWVIVGLRDQLFVRGGWDSWVRHLRQLVHSRIDPSPSHLVSFEHAEIAGQAVATIDVYPGTEPHFLRLPDKRADYFAREGAHTRLLVGSDITRHLAARSTPPAEYHGGDAAPPDGPSVKSSSTPER